MTTDYSLYPLIFLSLSISSIYFIPSTFNKRRRKCRRKETQWRMNQKAEPRSRSYRLDPRASLVSKNFSPFTTRDCLQIVSKRTADILHVEESRQGKLDSHLAGRPCTLSVRIGHVMTYRSKWCPPSRLMSIYERITSDYEKAERNLRQEARIFNKRKLYESKDSRGFSNCSMARRKGRNFMSLSLCSL